MSDKERKELYAKIELGMKLSTEKCLLEKKLRKEMVVVSGIRKKVRHISASEALRRFHASNPNNDINSVFVKSTQ